MKFNITNRVYTAAVPQELDLYSPSLLNLSRYKPPAVRFPGGCLRTDTGTCLVFKSGKLVFNGIKSDEGLNALAKYCTEALGSHVENITLRNVVGYARFDNKINLEKLQYRIRAFYEPELHPGLFLNFDRVCCIIYTTGAIFTGCTSHAMFKDVCAKIEQTIGEQ